LDLADRSICEFLALGGDWVGPYPRGSELRRMRFAKRVLSTDMLRAIVRDLRSPAPRGEQHSPKEDES